jgi:hypothetical protein
MYTSGETPMIGDVVQGDEGEGKVLAVTPNGPGGEETATVQWAATREKVPGSGIFAPFAPVSVPTRALRLVRRA